MAAGLSTYALHNRGGTAVRTSQTKHAAPAATNASGALVDIPLPARRPSAFRAQSRDLAPPRSNQSSIRSLFDF
jgi:hypothetical protein